MHTMGTARIHVEQPRNTLHFASCAKQVTTNAKVNVAMPDKAMVKHLQKEVERLESEQRDKNAHIEKLEKEIKHIILQRDIAQSQVKELLQILGDNRSPLTRVGLGNYPHLRVRKSPDVEIQGQETFVLEDTHSSDVDSRRGYVGRISGDHSVRPPYHSENFACSDASHRMFGTCSYSDTCDEYAYHYWEGVENKGILEDDSCQEIHCVSAGDYTRTPSVKAHVSREVQDVESVSSVSFQDESAMSSPLKDDTEIKEHEASMIIASNTSQKSISSSAVEDKESIQMLKNKEDSRSLQCVVVTSLDNPLQYLGITSLENPSLAHHLAKETFGNGILSLSGSKGSKASINTNSISSWLEVKQHHDCTPSFGSGKEFEGFEWKLSALNFGSGAENFTKKHSWDPSESALDMKINNPVLNLSAVEDVDFTGTPELREEAKFSTEQQMTTQPDHEVASRVTEPPKKNADDIGGDPFEEESKVTTSWPIEFKRLRRQIIELWHACSVSLVHRTYFFLLFRGDTSDSIYLEVEIRRLQYLKDKFSLGEKAVVNGQRLTLSSSKKTLRQERHMLTKQLMKKISEKERETLFLDWGIDVNTKRRRQQLADLIWTKTDDINHIENSALLVAKLVGIIEPGQYIDNETFGLNFSSQSGTGISTFKRSLLSLL